MNKVYYKKIFEQLDMSKGQNVAFWGASLFLQEFIRKNNLKKYNIVGIIDSDTSKCGEKIGDYEIISPSRIKDIQPLYIISTIQNNAKQMFSNIYNYIAGINQVCLFANIFNEISYGVNNNIYLIKNGVKEKVDFILGIEIIFKGNNNTVEIEAEPMPKFENCKFELVNNCQISIKSSCYNIKNLRIKHGGKNSKISIGKNFSIISGYFFLEDCHKIDIKDNCMCSTNVYITTTDGHTIYDNFTKQIVNKPKKKNIQIGNHVWLGNGVSILKNSKIGDNTVVGKGSIVNNAYEDTNIILAGVPAKIVKQGINWDRRTITDYEEEVLGIFKGENCDRRL